MKRSPWIIFPALISVCVILPVLSLVIYSGPIPESLQVTSVISNSLRVTIGTVVISTIIGIGSAWVMTFKRFPFQNLIHVLLFLPLAYPSYVLAFILIGNLDISGPIYAYLPFNLPPIRSNGGLILTLSISLYPYVYGLAKTGFEQQSWSIVETAQSLGSSSSQCFWKIQLPMAAPWILSGMVLVALETLADFGASSIFNIDTFTTTIYKIWFAYFSFKGAASFALLLLLPSVVLLIFDSKIRQKRRYFQETGHKPIQRTPLGTASTLVLTFAFGSLFLISIVIPFTTLICWAWTQPSMSAITTLLPNIQHSITIAIIASSLVAILGLGLAISERFNTSSLISRLNALSTLGYGIPGTVLAVASFSIFSVFQGIIAMSISYVIRYLSLGVKSITSAYQSISKGYDESAESLGVSTPRIITYIHLPLLKKGILTGMILVAIDVIKEMPIALMTRPFGWDTLSVAVYTFTEEGNWNAASLPALLLVIIGMLPVLLLSKRSSK